MNIDERTKIPLFATLVTLPILAGVCLWAGALSTRVDADEARLDRIVTAIKEDRSALKEYTTMQLKYSLEIRDKVNRIEGYLNSKETK